MSSCGSRTVCTTGEYRLNRTVEPARDAVANVAGVEPRRHSERSDSARGRSDPSPSDRRLTPRDECRVASAFRRCLFKCSLGGIQRQLERFGTLVAAAGISQRPRSTASMSASDRSGRTSCSLRVRPLRCPVRTASACGLVPDTDRSVNKRATRRVRRCRCWASPVRRRRAPARGKAVSPTDPQPGSAPPEIVSCAEVHQHDPPANLAHHVLGFDIAVKDPAPCTAASARQRSRPMLTTSSAGIGRRSARTAFSVLPSMNSVQMPTCPSMDSAPWTVSTLGWRTRASRRASSMADAGESERPGDAA